MLNNLYRLLIFARPQWLFLALIVLLGLLVTAINLFQAVLISRVLTGILTGRALADLALLLLGIAILLGFRALSAGGAEYLGVIVATRIKKALRRRLYHKLLELGPGWIGRTRSGLVQTALVDSLEMIQSYFSLIIPNTAISLLSVVILPLCIVAIDPVVGLAVLVCAHLATLVPIFTLWKLRRQIRFWWDRYYPMNAEYLDALQGMATLKSFNASRARGLELKAEAFKVRDAAIRLVMLELVPTSLVNFLIAVGTSCAVGLGALHVARGVLGISELLIVLLLVGQCFAPVLTLKRTFHYAYYVPTIAASIFELLDAATPVVEKTAARPRKKVGPPLVFDQVTFRYPAASRPALQDVSFTLSPGQNLALVGRSGAGKTTITSLMLRFFDPQQGRITLGGVDLRDMPLADLRRLFSVVSQDVYLFHGTIRENLLLARPEAQDGELTAAAQMAAAHDFIMATPDGYDTVVGERGLKLSGGERQRIAMARAFLKDAPILILDEATSSVDIANEAAIQEALKEVTRGRSVLTIAHRLSTVRRADSILVLDSGRLLENGDHQSLIELNGVYARLAAPQGGRS